jgi:hypothetical protein
LLASGQNGTSNSQLAQTTQNKSYWVLLLIAGYSYDPQFEVSQFNILSLVTEVHQGELQPQSHVCKRYTVHFPIE